MHDAQFFFYFFPYTAGLIIKNPYLFLFIFFYSLVENKSTVGITHCYVICNEFFLSFKTNPLWANEVNITR